MRKTSFHITVGRPNVRSVILAQASPVDCFVSDRVDDDCVRITNPLIMIINQKRLVGHSIDAIQQWLDCNPASNVDLSKYTSDQILDTIKSKYIQSPAELQSYLSYVESQLSDTAREILIKQKVSQTVVSDPKPADPASANATGSE